MHFARRLMLVGPLAVLLACGGDDDGGTTQPPPTVTLGSIVPSVSTVSVAQPLIVSVAAGAS